MKTKWVLRSIDISKLLSTGDYAEAVSKAETREFDRLANVWETIGGKLKRYCTGYGGMCGKIEYSLAGE